MDKTRLRLILIRDGLDRIAVLATGEEPQRLDKIIRKAKEIEEMILAWQKEIKEETVKENQAPIPQVTPWTTPMQGWDSSDGSR